MSQFVEVKTAELVGYALDWAVGKVCAKDDPRLYQEPKSSRWLFGPFGKNWNPSADWEQGGPLQDKYDVGIEPGVPDGLRYAYVPGRDLDGAFGETALIALCRAIVSAKLGDVVQVPAELMGVG